MAHEETIRMIPGAKTAVLLMHGIAGTPDHFRTLLRLEDLIPADWSVCNVRMPGHGGQPEDFSSSSLREWEAYCQHHFNRLCRTHDRVILVGHSMGTLFAIRMALEHPEKVPFLFLIEVPLRVGVKLFGVCNLIRFAFGKLDLADPVQEAVSRVCSIEPTWKVWRYIGWLPRLVELIRRMHDSARQVSELTVPAIAYQAKRDELVSDRSRKILIASGKVDVRNFERSTHFYYHPEETALVREVFSRRIQSI